MEDVHLQDSSITGSLKEPPSARILSSLDDDDSSNSSDLLPSLDNLFRKKESTLSNSIADVIEKVVAATTSPEAPEINKSDTTFTNQINKSDEDDGGKTEEEEMKTTEDESKKDESDDYCSVCDDGGRLFCCSKCPRVFHKSCHVPALPTEPDDNWSCLLCEDVINSADFSDLMLSRKRSASSSRRQPTNLIGYDLKACERILLELFCNKNSMPFHYKVDKKNAPGYYEIITQPMDLGIVRMKVSPSCFDGYKSKEEVFQDIRLIFDNCCKYNREGTQFFEMARKLEKYFEELLQTYFPQCTRRIESPEF